MIGKHTILDLIVISFKFLNGIEFISKDRTLCWLIKKNYIFDIKPLHSFLFNINLGFQVNIPSLQQSQSLRTQG